MRCFQPMGFVYAESRVARDCHGRIIEEAHCLQQNYSSTLYSRTTFFGKAGKATGAVSCAVRCSGLRRLLAQSPAVIGAVSGRHAVVKCLFLAVTAFIDKVQLHAATPAGTPARTRGLGEVNIPLSRSNVRHLCPELLYVASWTVTRRMTNDTRKRTVGFLSSLSCQHLQYAEHIVITGHRCGAQHRSSKQRRHRSSQII